MTTHATEILVVDDEIQLRRLLVTLLSSASYHVRAAAGAAEGLKLAIEQPPDLVILDLMMPGMNGIDACRSLREWFTGPILFLTVNDSDRSIISALDAGGDDYLTKPFSSGELLARVRALLRRAQPSTTQLVAGALTIDLAHRSVALDGVSMTVTPTEFDILALLVRHNGCIVTQQEILNTVWGDDDSAMLPTLRMHVSNLRKKLSTPTAEYATIDTISRIGYRFQLDGAAV